MRFSPELVRRILDDRKTQTRRPAKWIDVSPDKAPLLTTPSQKSPRSQQKVRYTHQFSATPKALAPCKYAAEKDYALQETLPGPGQAAKTVSSYRLFVTSVSEKPVRLGAMKHADAVAEGFRSLAEFQAYWRRLHGAYDTETLVWVIEFKAVHDPEAYRDAPRLMAVTGRGDEHGITHNPSEAVDDGDEPGVERPPADWEKGNTQAKERDFDVGRLARFEESLNGLEAAAQAVRSVLGHKGISDTTRADAEKRLRTLERQIRVARAKVVMFDRHVA
jgi:hypothetical protein